MRIKPSVRLSWTNGMRKRKDLAVLSSHQFLLWSLGRWNHCDITAQRPLRCLCPSSSWAWTINLPKSLTVKMRTAKAAIAPVAPSTPSSGMVAFSSWSSHIFYCHTSTVESFYYYYNWVTSHVPPILPMSREMNKACNSHNKWWQWWSRRRPRKVRSLFI